jgi:hypothetical protein
LSVKLLILSYSKSNFVQSPKINLAASYTTTEKILVEEEIQKMRVTRMEQSHYFSCVTGDDLDSGIYDSDGGRRNAVSIM